MTVILRDTWIAVCGSNASVEHDNVRDGRRTAMSSTGLLVGSVLAIMLTSSQIALAQPAPSCTIGPNAPVFEAGAGGDQLHPPPPEKRPHFAGHNQVLYGQDTLYLSHLGVFMGDPGWHPHNFQVILEVEFDDPGDFARYQADRKQNPDKIYTVSPPPFDQGSLVSEASSAELLLTLPGSTVIRGHLEKMTRERRAEETIIPEATFKLKHVIYFREFFLNGPKLQEQNYLLFGRGNDVFLSHLLSAPPDFDQFLAVELKVTDPPSESDRDLIESFPAEGLYLRLSDRENTVATRLRAGDVLTCNLLTDRVAALSTVELRVTDELYCEEGDLESLVMSPQDFGDLRDCES